MADHYCKSCEKKFVSIVIDGELLLTESYRKGFSGKVESTVCPPEWV